jgi:uncharacterized RDD family membrane protein YckC
MDDYPITTPHSFADGTTDLPYDPPYAGFWRRSAACIIDGWIITLPTLILAVIAGVALGLTQSGGNIQQLTQSPAWTLLDLGINVISLLLAFGYYAYFESQQAGQTPGRKALGIALQSVDDTQPIDMTRSILRQLARWLSAWTLGIGFKMQLWTAKRQTLHDKMLNCVVVRVKPQGTLLPWVINGITFGGLIIAWVALCLLLIAGLSKTL